MRGNNGTSWRCVAKRASLPPANADPAPISAAAALRSRIDLGGCDLTHVVKWRPTCVERPVKGGRAALRQWGPSLIPATLLASTRLVPRQPGGGTQHGRRSGLTVGLTLPCWKRKSQDSPRLAIHPGMPSEAHPANSGTRHRMMRRAGAEMAKTLLNLSIHQRKCWRLAPANISAVARLI